MQSALPSLVWILSAVAGALLRLAISRILADTGTPRRNWVVETTVAVVLGAAVALPMLQTNNIVLTGGFGAGLTTYSAASGALALFAAQHTNGARAGAFLAHFLISTVAAGLGFAAMLSLGQLT